MLCLTRKPGDTIRIGDSIILTVLVTHTGTVRLGIDAPRDVVILRGEMAETGAAGATVAAGAIDSAVTAANAAAQADAAALPTPDAVPATGVRILIPPDLTVPLASVQPVRVGEDRRASGT